MRTTYNYLQEPLTRRRMLRGATVAGAGLAAAWMVGCSSGKKASDQGANAPLQPATQSTPDAEKPVYGGVMIGHDYYVFRRQRVGSAVVDAVNSFTTEHGITEWYLTDPAADVEKSPTYFWANE